MFDNFGFEQDLTGWTLTYTSPASTYRLPPLIWPDFIGPIAQPWLPTFAGHAAVLGITNTNPNATDLTLDAVLTSDLFDVPTTPGNPPLNITGWFRYAQQAHWSSTGWVSQLDPIPVMRVSVEARFFAGTDGLAPHLLYDSNDDNVGAWITEWQQFDSTFTPPAGATSMRLVALVQMRGLDWSAVGQETHTMPDTLEQWTHGVVFDEFSVDTATDAAVEDTLRLRLPAQGTTPARWIATSDAGPALAINIGGQWYPQNPNGVPLKIMDEDATWKEVGRFLKLRPRSIEYPGSPISPATMAVPDGGCFHGVYTSVSSNPPPMGYTGDIFYDANAPAGELFANSDSLKTHGYSGIIPNLYDVYAEDTDHATSVLVVDVSLLKQAVPRFRLVAVTFQVIEGRANYSNYNYDTLDLEQGPLGPYYGYLYQMDSVEVESVVMQSPDWAAGLVGRRPTTGDVSGTLLHTWSANAVTPAGPLLIYTPEQIPSNGMLIYGLKTDTVEPAVSPSYYGYNATDIVFHVEVQASIYP